MALRVGLFDTNERGTVERLSVERLPARSIVELVMHASEGGREFLDAPPRTKFTVRNPGEETGIELVRTAEGECRAYSVFFLGSILNKMDILVPRDEPEIEWGQVLVDHSLVVANRPNSQPKLLPGIVKAVINPDMQALQLIEQSGRR